MKLPRIDDDTLFRIGTVVWAVLILVGLTVLLSGHGIIPDPAHRVSPTGVTTTMGTDGAVSADRSSK